MDASKVAYHGVVTIVGATHSLTDGGLKLKLKLPVEDDYRVFAGFTKRRKNKAGTRHRMYLRKAIEQGGVEKRFESYDAMFLGWSVSNSSGAVVAFEVERECFEWLEDNGTDGSFELVLSEIDDNESEVDQDQRRKIEDIQKGGPMSKHAARLCLDPEFMAYVRSKTGNDTTAADYVRSECRVESRAQIDHSTAAAERYKALHSDFLRWSVQL